MTALQRDPEHGYHQRSFHHVASPPLTGRSQHDIHRRLGTYMCQQCGGFYSRRQDRPGAFCSRACQGKAKKKQVACLCQHCGAIFERCQAIVQRGEALYCSRACCQAHGWCEVECPTCQKRFTVKRHKLRSRKFLYCSVACVPSLQGKPRIFSRTGERLAQCIVCSFCGSPFAPTRQQHSRAQKGLPVYCAAPCRKEDRKARITAKRRRHALASNVALASSGANSSGGRGEEIGGRPRRTG